MCSREERIARALKNVELEHSVELQDMINDYFVEDDNEENKSVDEEDDLPYASSPVGTVIHFPGLSDNRPIAVEPILWWNERLLTLICW